ncbi:hypothetical protein [Streptomyces laculatispora]|nr:hypothetical protein [Streptomyces laculatispora]MBO0914106.1 hypothetical protein [Streptomyces laculatispora]
MLGFVVFAAVAGWQVYAITRSAHSRLRAIEAFGINRTFPQADSRREP